MGKDNEIVLDNQYKRLINIRNFSSGAKRDSSFGKPNCHDLQGYTMLRFGYHMELGEQRYGESNYLKGIPNKAVIESMARHYAKAVAGYTDEDHLSAIIFAAQCLMLNQEKDGISADYYYNKLKVERQEKEEG